MEVNHHIVAAATTVAALAGACTLIMPSASLQKKGSSLRVLLCALAVGSLLGDTIFHILPQIYAPSDNSHAHHEHHAHDPHHNHQHDHDHDHDHGHLGHGEMHGHSHGAQDLCSAWCLIGSYLFCLLLSSALHLRTGTLNLLTDAFHNFMDGIAIAVAFQSSLTAGYATAVAAALHELPQELSDSGILISSGYSKTQALFWNLACAMTCVAGSQFPTFLDGVPQSCMLACVAGSFLYISLTELVPDLLESNHRLIMWIGISCGLSVMYGMLLVEHDVHQFVSEALHHYSLVH
jgi:zinc transporter ZupT